METKRNSKLTKVLALIAAFVLCITAVPMMASAEDVTSKSGENVAIQDITTPKVPNKPVAATIDNEVLVNELDNAQMSGAKINATNSYYYNPPGSCSITITNSGVATINATVTNGYFIGVVVDQNNSRIAYNWNASSKYTRINNLTVDLSKYEIGYHKIQVFTQDKNNTSRFGIFEKTVYYNNITAKPSYNGVFNVYHNYFNYYPYSSSAYISDPSNHKLFIEYSADGGKSWKMSNRMQYNMIQLFTSQGFKISGLNPNTTYLTRVSYGEYGRSQNGGTIVITGPKLNTTTIRTGKAKAPKIKSVKVKAVKVKFHKHRVPGSWQSTGYSVYYVGPWTERYYTYKLKVTVKLKKKPGVQKGGGVYINMGGYTKFVKGNKKKYTATFTPYPNYRTKRPPKGMGKINVQIASYQNKTWAGYSPFANRKRKIK